MGPSLVVTGKIFDCFVLHPDSQEREKMRFGNVPHQKPLFWRPYSSFGGGGCGVCALGRHLPMFYVE